MPYEPSFKFTDDRRSVGKLLIPNADICIVAISLGRFFLANPQYASEEEKNLIDGFLGASKAGVLASVKNFPGDWLGINPIDSEETKTVDSLYKQYYVSQEKCCLLKEFINKNFHCNIASDADCVGSSAILSAHRIIVETPNPKTQEVIKVPFLIVSRIAWEQICKLAHKPKPVLYHKSDSYFPKLIAEEEWKKYYLSQVHWLGKIYSRHYHSIFDKGSHEEVKWKLKERAKEHPNGASDKTCMHFKLT